VLDDDGASAGSLSLSVPEGRALHIDSRDMAGGNHDKGLFGSTDPGEGAWRLDLATVSGVEVLTYVRTSDDMLASMHDVAPKAGDVHRVPIFEELGIKRVYNGAIAYTPDGRFLATLSNSYQGAAAIELLDPESFISVHRIDSVEGRHIQFSPDGSQMAIFGNKAAIQLRNVEPPRLRATIPVETVNVAFSPDGRYLAYTIDDTVYLWHLREKQVVKELTN